MNGSFVVVGGETGEQIAMQEIASNFEVALLRGSPYQITLETEISSPSVSLEEAEALTGAVAEIASEPLLISILDQEVIIQPRQMRDWFTTTRNDDDEAEWAVRADTAIETISAEFPNLGLRSRGATKPDPEFTVIDLSLIHI